MRCVLPGIMLYLAVACEPPATDRVAGTTTAAATSSATETGSRWYDRSRTLDLTGDGRVDAVRLTASDGRPDDRRIALVLLVGGEVKHREEWGSSYELAMLDSAGRSSGRADTVLRAQLDSVLASVVVEPLTARGVRLLAEDIAILRRLTPPPTHRISFSYGFESTTRLVWDASRERFVPLWRCC